jgi:hypothetical protein
MTQRGFSESLFSTLHSNSTGNVTNNNEKFFQSISSLLILPHGIPKPLDVSHDSNEVLTSTENFHTIYFIYKTKSVLKLRSSLDNSLFSFAHTTRCLF